MLKRSRIFYADWQKRPTPAAVQAVYYSLYVQPGVLSAHSFPEIIIWQIRTV